MPTHALLKARLDWSGATATLTPRQGPVLRVDLPKGTLRDKPLFLRDGRAVLVAGSQAVFACGSPETLTWADAEKAIAGGTGLGRRVWLATRDQFGVYDLADGGCLMRLVPGGAFAADQDVVPVGIYAAAALFDTNLAVLDGDGRHSLTTIQSSCWLVRGLGRCVLAAGRDQVVLADIQGATSATSSGALGQGISDFADEWGVLVGRDHALVVDGLAKTIREVSCQGQITGVTVDGDQATVTSAGHDPQVIDRA